MKFAYRVLFYGKEVGEKSVIVPSYEAYEHFINEKNMRHLRIGSINRPTGFQFLSA